ncbi:YGGT family protein [Candidatus Gullanella endobia]|uniref:YGGT family protein n=1 Tax=Candidatus Gullanella endobia TaxID=1070130 RepID=A0A143WRE8_9ENTR|nr:YggT family protein [Candidatus Gullanella endobia]CUX96181.1 YGGT family protein [Candidatus Gullanella endobia]
MLTLIFLVKRIINIYIMAFLLRGWMQWMHCDFYNPFSQFIVKITQPMINLTRRVIFILIPLRVISLLLAFILAVIKLPLLMLIEMHTFILDPIYVLIGLLALLKSAGELVFLVVIIRSLLNWVSQKNTPIDVIIYQLSEPIIYSVSRIFPVKYGIDFSAIVIIFILYTLNYLFMDLFSEIWYRL